MVTLGTRRARCGWVMLVAGAYAMSLALVAAQLLQGAALVVVLSAPLAAYVARVLLRHHADRQLVAANRDTIRLHLFAGALLALGTWLG